MARTAGSLGEKTQAAILAAALNLFARHGYEAVSMRKIAADVGVQAAALYRYFPTKEELLFTLLDLHLRDLTKSWDAARPTSHDATAQLAAFVAHHLGFHIERRPATHVANMDLRSLTKDRLSAILKLRGAYEKELRVILRDGVEQGMFAIDDAGLAAMAILQMISGVIVWFRPDGKLSVEDVTKIYLAMTMRLVGVKEDANVSQHT
jgi:AcrR family transcriptional regulator